MYGVLVRWDPTASPAPDMMSGCTVARDHQKIEELSWPALLDKLAVAPR